MFKFTPFVCFDDDAPGVNGEVADTSTEDEQTTDQSTGEEPEIGEVDEADSADQQGPDMNHIYAEARRRAEAEAAQRYEARQAEIDKQYANMFGQYKNPETGAPITSAADYAEAMAAQNRVRLKSQMQESGIDTSMLDQAIANSPVVRQAQQAIEENQSIRAQQMIDEDMRAILSFDPSVNSAEDIESQDNFMEIVAYCQQTGMRFSDAYKLVNFDRLSSARVRAAEQGAINQSRSKDHLTAVAGLANQDSSLDIPSGDIARWKEFFPGKSMKELKALYNKVHK